MKQGHTTEPHMYRAGRSTLYFADMRELMADASSLSAEEIANNAWARYDHRTA